MPSMTQRTQTTVSCQQFTIFCLRISGISLRTQFNSPNGIFLWMLICFRRSSPWFPNRCNESHNAWGFIKELYIKTFFSSCRLRNILKNAHFFLPCLATIFHHLFCVIERVTSNEARQRWWQKLISLSISILYGHWTHRLFFVIATQRAQA